jgi:malate dehydrogenase (oxaloacetate-decarboxylating)
MPSYFERSIAIHEKFRGKIEIRTKCPLASRDDLSLAYTPGVAGPCMEIVKDRSAARRLTLKGNTVAVITDGSAVLGLGNIGPEAALPVMEGKALLFKECAGVDAWPICLDTQDIEELVRTIRYLAPTFGGINLEDIAAPRCFEIEERLQDLGIPVFHDDQHGTAIVSLAALMNAVRVVGKQLDECAIVISGAGAAGIAIAKLLLEVGVGELIICDSVGAISNARNDLNDAKRKMVPLTNPRGLTGSLTSVLKGADVFIGVSSGSLLKSADVATMAPGAIVLAMANPYPEIMPDEAKAGGVAVVGTGRSDFPNQVNNALAFPGIFRGALDICAPRITTAMCLAAAEALAGLVAEPSAEEILPTPIWDPAIAKAVAKAVAAAALVVPEEAGALAL